MKKGDAHSGAGPGNGTPVPKYSMLVASFGSDVDFVPRMAATGKYRVVKLLSLYTSEEVFERVRRVYHTLSAVCRSPGVGCEHGGPEPRDLQRGVQVYHGG